MRAGRPRGKYEPRLFPDLVRAIRAWYVDYSAVPKPRDICRTYNISREQLYNVVHRKTYKAVR
jgi:hypothetical protein